MILNINITTVQIWFYWWKQTAHFGDGNALLFLDQQGVICWGLHVSQKTSTTFYSRIRENRETHIYTQIGRILYYWPTKEAPQCKGCVPLNDKIHRVNKSFITPFLSSPASPGLFSQFPESNSPSFFFWANMVTSSPFGRSSRKRTASSLMIFVKSTLFTC